MSVCVLNSVEQAGVRGLTVALGNVVDELHDEHGLADTGTSEETNLSATGVWGKQIHDLRCKEGKSRDGIR